MRQADKAAEDAARRDRAGADAARRLRQRGHHHRAQRQRPRDGDHEAGPPVEMGLQHATQDRCNGGDDAHDGAHPGQFAASAWPLVEVAHDGPPQHDRPRPAEGLQGPHGNQPVDAWRQRAGPGRHDEDRQSGQQHRPAPEAVRQGPPDQLPDGEPDQEQRQRELRPGRIGAQRPGDGRQGRQIHVRRQRSERGQERQNDRQGQRVGTQQHGMGLGGKTQAV